MDAHLHADELDRPVKEVFAAFQCSTCVNSYTMSHGWFVLWIGDKQNWICSHCQKQLTPDQLARGYFKVTADPFARVVEYKPDEPDAEMGYAP